MIPFKTILVPVDFDASSDPALTFAITLAQRFDAKLVLMHACDADFYAYPVYPTLALRDTGDAVEAAARAWLTDLAARIGETYANVTSVLTSGKAWRSILKAAEDERADVIVVGTHGRHGAAHALLGSVAERVVRASTVPVITVRSAATAVRAKGAAPAAGDEDVDHYERRISRPNVATIEAATFSGAVAGATIGAFGGPIGAIAGGWIGTAIGAAAGLTMDEEQASQRVHTEELDVDSGVMGGDIGAAKPKVAASRK